MVADKNFSARIALPARNQSADRGALYARARRTWLATSPVICGIAVNHISPDAIRDLTLAENSFLSGRRALLNDVFNFIWRLSPHYRHPTAPDVLIKWRPRARARGPLRTLHRLLVLWRAFGSLRAARVFFCLERRIAALDLFRAEEEIHAYLIRFEHNQARLVNPQI